MMRAPAMVGRILLVAAGALAAVVAVFLVVWGLRALRATPPVPVTGDDQGVAAVDLGDTDGGQAATEARWQWFSGTPRSGADPSPAREVQRLPGPASSPFDRAYARRELSRIGLRLEGVGRGTEKLALISGRVTRIGDRIAGYEVVSIDRTEVTLMAANGVLVTLTAEVRRGGERGGDDSEGGRPGAAARGSDGPSARLHRAPGRTDVPPTDPNLAAGERDKAESVSRTRFTTRPRESRPQPPSTRRERDNQSGRRPGP